MLIEPIKALLLHKNNPHTQCAESYTPATLLGTPCQYHVGTLFALRTAFILSGIDSDILVHSDMIACSCCGFVGCTAMMGISHHHIQTVLYFIEIW